MCTAKLVCSHDWTLPRILQSTETLSGEQKFTIQDMTAGEMEKNFPRKVLRVAKESIEHFRDSGDKFGWAILTSVNQPIKLYCVKTKVDEWLPLVKEADWNRKCVTCEVTFSGSGF